MRPPTLQELTNPGRVLGAATRSPARGVSEPPPFGMTMWFSVSVPDLDRNEPRSLGYWSACSGLEVTMTPEGPFDEGGNYTSPQYLPGKIGYNKITLERVMTPDGAGRVRAWLDQLSEQWVEGTSVPASKPVVIALYTGVGPNAVKVHDWVLRNPFPVSWSVPSFSTTGSGGFAVEKLVLQHSGFLKEGKLPAAGTRLMLEDEALNRLEFQYNPAKVALKKSLPAATGKKQFTNDNVVVDANSLGITLSDLRLDGTGKITKAIATLRGWVERNEVPGIGGATGVPSKPTALEPCKKCGKPQSSSKDAAAAGTLRPLRVVWGPSGGGMPSRMVLKSFDLTMTRFTADGTPSRATVSLTLQEHAITQAFGRPLTIGTRTAPPRTSVRAKTSSGQPGRRPEDPLRARGGAT